MILFNTHLYSLVQILWHLDSLNSVVVTTVLVVDVVVAVVVLAVLAVVSTVGFLVTNAGGKGRVTMSSIQDRTGPPAMLLMSV